MKPALHIARCPHCGGSHSADAHRDPAYALRLAEEAFQRGAITDGRLWVGVARKCLKEGRK
jgi:hypothetical protein